MAIHALWDHFDYFFGRLNPSPSFERQASSEHTSITKLIEDPSGPASVLAPQCFLQGSYKQQTAIYDINDVDIVVLCKLWLTSPGASTGRMWYRDDIFDTIAAPLRNDWRYSTKIRYSPTSMCVKVDLGIKVEILPVMYKPGNNAPNREPFLLYRPETGRWEDGYARLHQQQLSAKNNSLVTGGRYIPAIKVFKHLRSQGSVKAVSFHIESLLFVLPNNLFYGGPADYIPALLSHIASIPAITWYNMGITTPCMDRYLFSDSEWSWAEWEKFHSLIARWAHLALLANQMTYRDTAIAAWQTLLGSAFFPKEVSS